MLAKTHIEILKEGTSIFDFLDIARELYLKFPEDDIWFSDYLKKIKTAYEADETPFSKELFLDRFGTVMESDKQERLCLPRTCSDYPLPGAFFGRYLSSRFGPPSG
jgi:hypothetical protein